MAKRKEEWKVVNGYPDYKVSNFGELKKKRATGKKKLTVNNCGYLTTRLSNEEGGKVHKVQRLVADAFIKSLEPGDVVFYKDGNRLNNKVDNLEVRKRSVLTDEDVKFIRSNAKKLGGSISGADLARKYGVSHVAIIKILNGSIRK